MPPDPKSEFSRVSTPSSVRKPENPLAARSQRHPENPPEILLKGTQGILLVLKTLKASISEILKKLVLKGTHAMSVLQFLQVLKIVEVSN